MQNGAGIDRIDFLVIENPGGQVVHEAVEQTARFYAFGGNDPCEEWRYADNDLTWPGGLPIASGTYIFRAVVHASSGQTIAVETTVDIDLED